MVGNEEVDRCDFRKMDPDVRFFCVGRKPLTHVRSYIVGFDVNLVITPFIACFNKHGSIVFFVLQNI